MAMRQDPSLSPAERQHLDTHALPPEPSARPPYAPWTDEGDAVTCPVCHERIEERKNATHPARYAKHWNEKHSPRGVSVDRLLSIAGDAAWARRHIKNQPADTALDADLLHDLLAQIIGDAARVAEVLGIEL